jgi:hypothetical protein
MCARPQASTLLPWVLIVGREFSADRLWLVHLREFNATGKGDIARHLRAVLGAVLMADAFRCGVQAVEATVTEDGWVLIGSDTEWLQLNLPQPMESCELFRRLIHWPGDSLRTRHEFHVATASSDVFIGRGDSIESIKGVPPPNLAREAARRHAFVLGYRLPYDTA